MINFTWCEERSLLGTLQHFSVLEHKDRKINSSPVKFALLLLTLQSALALLFLEP